MQGRTGLMITANLLVAWTFVIPLTIVAGTFLPGGEGAVQIATSLLMPWIVGVVVLGVLYGVQR